MLGKWENKRRTLPTPESQLRVEPETNGLLEQGSLLYLCSRMYMRARLTTSSSWRPGWRHKAATQKLKLSGTVAATRRLVMGNALNDPFLTKKEKEKENELWSDPKNSYSTECLAESQLAGKLHTWVGIFSIQPAAPRLHSDNR